MTVDSVTSNIENLRLSKYNFNIDLAELVAAISKIESTKRPKSMRSNPSQRDLSLFCDYHGTYMHRTTDCRHLRDEVARLLKDDHLREFLTGQAKDNYGRNRDPIKQEVQVEPCHMINMIIDEPMNTEPPLPIKRDELSGAYHQRTQSLEQNYVLPVADKKANETSPRSDALVISAMINHHRITDVVVDPRISANVIQRGGGGHRTVVNDG
ncbi:uncharacterized protein LOC132061361 [Lycium ferocissimum]|uniref:uncharacterized protein LOC132061361 n=1 Tax=Lycium ferocissimum TaxID=112874 RepID=UPI0028167E95|nr:uncharacterized protein LOC132061361 [Lycium ferocissimum]